MARFERITIKRDYLDSAAVVPVFIVPRVSITEDGSSDITDAWSEITDPENIVGDTCEALFAHEDCDVPVGLDDSRICVWPRLIGLRVTDENGTRDYDRDYALRLFGDRMIRLCEADEFERLN